MESLLAWGLGPDSWSSLHFVLRPDDGDLGAKGPVHGCLGKEGKRGRNLLRDFSYSDFAFGGILWGGRGGVRGS